MNRTWKTAICALSAAFSLGGLCAHAMRPRDATHGGQTRTHAATREAEVVAATLTPAWDPLAEDRKLAQPPAADPGRGSVRIEARVDRRSVLVNGDGMLQVQLTLQAPEPTSSAPRKPSDVLVVMDVSGSMEGQKIAYGRRALHELIERLQPEDRFGLVSYESDAHMVVPLQAAEPGSLARFHKAVDTLDAIGGTNMSAGLDLGLQQLARRADKGRSARVLLLSDGHANQGDSSLSGLSARARRIVQTENVLTTLGIGDDFNEDLMSSLAEVGTGNFYYLSRVETIGHFFDAELRATALTLASALTLRFEAEDGVVLEDLSGYPVEREGNVFTVRPGNLFAGQKRTLWVTLKAPTESARTLSLGRFELSYKEGDKPQLAAAPALPQLACTPDRAAFEKGIEREVWEQAVLKNQLSKGRMAVGKAISHGTAADVDKEVRRYEDNAELARSLGSRDVLESIDALKAEATSAKSAQTAAPQTRNREAKKAKATALYDLRRDSYNADPKSGL